jgi:hypothetical protein
MVVKVETVSYGGQETPTNEFFGATHLLYVENPRGMAESLAAFFVRHPLKGRDTQPAR